MFSRLLIVACLLLLLPQAASAQTPSPEALSAARKLVTTMKLDEQFKALLPAILFNLRPALTQDRPEIEQDFDALTPVIVNAFEPYYNGMVNDLASVYANNFTLDELNQLLAFYQQPTGQKLLQKSSTIAQQTIQVSQDASRKVSDDLRARLTEALRARGHKL
jgi:uncharacterized protein